MARDSRGDVHAPLAAHAPARDGHEAAAPVGRRSLEVGILHYRPGAPVTRERRQVLAEAPLLIQVAGGESYTVMRTPGEDRELALGFLFAEGIVRSLADVRRISPGCDGGNTVTVELAAPPTRVVRRNLVVSSACGLCGRADLDALLAELESSPRAPAIALDRLFALPARLRKRQTLFRLTGGSHAAGLFDARGELLVVGEDLGRHSALDKVIGRALAEALPLAELGVILSGRASLEMVVKAARARLGLVVAVSAPSEAAVTTARRLGISLCGFARGDELAVYTHDRWEGLEASDAVPLPGPR
ncbi:MAG: formate dehydrogenase accessory sulfurtransferase FdhD [Deltaproteobacteria bacterium]|nr:formate dehydrogenase accessory sulfurtransferase FdhD [Deltaproteobacteria bacterium]